MLFIDSRNLNKMAAVYTVHTSSIRIIVICYVYMNITLRRFLHNHGNNATEGSPKPGLCPTLISNGFKGSL